MTSKKPLNDSVFNGVISLLASGAGQSVLQILVLAFFARLVTPSAFAVMAIALAVSDIMRVFARIGITQALVQAEDVNDRIVRVGFTMSFCLSTLSAIVLFLLSSTIAELLRMNEMVDVLKAMACVFPFVSFSLTSEALLSRNLKFSKIALARLIAYIIGFVFVGLALAYSGMGYWALIYAYITQQIVQSVIIIYKAPHSYKPLFDFNIIKKMLKFGFGYSMGQLATILALRVDSFIIARTLGPVALSFYDRSYQLMRFPAFLLATIVDDAMFPILSRMQHDLDMMRKTFQKGLGLLAIALLPLSAFVVVTSESIIYILMGEQWLNAIPVLQILSIAMFFRSAQRVSTATLRAKGIVYLSAFFQFVYFAMVVLAVYIGGEWGINGVAIGVSLAIFMNFILITYFAMKQIKLGVFDALKPIVSALPITIIVTILSYFIQQYSILKNLNHALSLFGIVSMNILVLLPLIFFFPKILLGSDGFWLTNKILEKIQFKYRFS
jgi:PST family polysaccharide transporter